MTVATSPIRLYSDELASPIGTLLVVTTATDLIALEFGDMGARMNDYLTRRCGDYSVERTADPLGVTTRLSAYLGGHLDVLDDIPVDAAGTGFQRSVWGELRRIRVGETISYAELARRVGQSGASRAVGTANSKNPVGIVVPCHRVIAANGKLSGYAGGVERKRWLLEHERATNQLNLGW